LYRCDRLFSRGDRDRDRDRERERERSRSSPLSSRRSRSRSLLSRLRLLSLFLSLSRLRLLLLLLLLLSPLLRLPPRDSDRARSPRPASRPSMAARRSRSSATGASRLDVSERRILIQLSRDAGGAGAGADYTSRTSSSRAQSWDTVPRIPVERSSRTGLYMIVSKCSNIWMEEHASRLSTHPVDRT
jgi:hypothetical protein